MKKKYKLILVICVVLTLCANIFAPLCDGVKVNAATIKLNKTKLSLEVGRSATLKVSGTKKKVTWSSSKKKVATVNSKGKVTANEVGTATITAKVNGKNYKCKVTVKQTYGSVEGNVTYLYNNYRGNVSDTNATVILVPKNEKALDMPVLDSYIMWDMKSEINEEGNKYGVYSTTVDGKGEYSIQNVPTGEYIIYIKSEETTSGTAFDDIDSYREFISSQFEGYLDSENADMIAKIAGYSKVLIDEITIYKDQTTKFSNDFGITYI